LTRAGASDVNLSGILAASALLGSRRGARSAAVRALREAIEHSREVGDRPTLLGNLTTGIELAANVGAFGLAVLLAAKESSAGFNFIGTQYLIDYDGALARARDRLGAERYEELWARGTEMSFDQVVEFALTDLDRLLTELEDKSR
jgi:hypothetical protein